MSKISPAPKQIRIILIMAFAILGTLLASCQSQKTTHKLHTVSGYLFTAGTLAYLTENAALEIEINLIETQTPGSIPVVIQQTRLSGSNQWPYSYTLEYDPALLNSAYTYNMQALVSFNSQLVALTTDPHRISPEQADQQYDLLLMVLGAQAEPITGFTIYCGFDNYELSIYPDKLINDDLQDYRRLIFEGSTDAGENRYQREQQVMILNPDRYPQWLVAGQDKNCGQ